MPSPSTPTPSTLPRHLAIEQCVLMDTFYIPGDGTSKACCARINGFAQDLIADLMDSSAEGATVEQCSGDGVNVGGDCYETTMGALEGAEDSFGQENMVAPFVEACETLMTITESPVSEHGSIDTPRVLLHLYSCTCTTARVQLRMHYLVFALLTILLPPFVPTCVSSHY